MSQETKKAQIVLNKLPMIISPEKSYQVKDVENYLSQERLRGDGHGKLGALDRGDGIPKELNRDSRKGTPSSAEICAKRVLRRAKRGTHQTQLREIFLSPGDREDFKDDVTRGRGRGRPKGPGRPKLRREKGAVLRKRTETAQHDASKDRSDKSQICPTCGSKFESAKEKQAHVVVCLKDKYSMKSMKSLPSEPKIKKRKTGKGDGSAQETDEELAQRILLEEKLEEEMQERKDAELARRLQEGGGIASTVSPGRKTCQNCLKDLTQMTAYKRKQHITKCADQSINKGDEGACGDPRDRNQKNAKTVGESGEDETEKYICQFCQKDLTHVTEERKMQHMNRCIDLSMPSQEVGDKKIRPATDNNATANATSTPTDNVVCQFCNTDLTHLTLDEKTQHINRCIDSNTSSPTQEVHAAGSKTSAAVHTATRSEDSTSQILPSTSTSLPTDSVICQFCKRDLTHLSVERKTQHINRCIDLSICDKGVAEETKDETKPCPAVPLSPTAMCASASTDQVTCQFCNKDLTHMIMERREVHVNRCIDINQTGEGIPNAATQKNATRPSNSVAVVEDPTAQASGVVCPVCKKNIKALKGPQFHIKKCALKNKVSTIQLMDMMKQQKQTAAAATTSVEAKQATLLQQTEQKTKKPRKLKPPETVHAEQLALAKAMSLSLKNQEQELGNKPRRGRRGAKNKAQTVPTLLQKSHEEVQRGLEERMSCILSESEFEMHQVVSTPPMKSSNLAKKSRGQKNNGQLWSIAGKCDPKKSKHEEFYVQNLQPVISLVRLNPEKLKTPVKSPGNKFSTQEFGETCQILAELVREGGLTPSPSKPSTTQQSKARVPSQSSYQQELVRDLSSMVNNPQYSDVIIHVDENQKIHGHSFMLGSRCKYLAKIISETKVHKGKISLHWEDVSFDEAMIVVKFIYSAEIDIPVPCLGSVLQLAERFEIKDLQKRCHEILDEKSNVGGWGREEEKESPAEQTTEEEEEEFTEKDVDELLDSLWGEDSSSGKRSRNNSPRSENPNDSEEFEKELDGVYEYMSTQRATSTQRKIEPQVEGQSSGGQRAERKEESGQSSGGSERCLNESGQSSESNSDVSKVMDMESPVDVQRSPDGETEDRSPGNGGEIQNSGDPCQGTDSSGEREIPSSPLAESPSSAVVDTKHDGSPSVRDAEKATVSYETPLSRNQKSHMRIPSVTPDLFGGDESFDVESEQQDKPREHERSFSAAMVTPEVLGDYSLASKRRRFNNVSPEPDLDMSVDASIQQMEMEAEPSQPIMQPMGDSSGSSKEDEDVPSHHLSSPEDIEMQDVENGNESGGGLQDDTKMENRHDEGQIIISSGSEEEKDESMGVFGSESPVFRATQSSNAGALTPQKRLADITLSQSPSPKFGASQQATSLRNRLQNPGTADDSPTEVRSDVANKEKETAEWNEDQKIDGQDAEQIQEKAEEEVFEIKDDSDRAVQDDSLIDFMDDGGFNMDMCVPDIFQGDDNAGTEHGSADEMTNLGQEEATDHESDSEVIGVKQKGDSNDGEGVADVTEVRNDNDNSHAAKGATPDHSSGSFTLDLDSSLIWTANQSCENQTSGKSGDQFAVTEMTTPTMTSSRSWSKTSVTPTAVVASPDSPITPMPDYQDMATPVLKGELNKFGVRAVPRRKAVTLLKSIYDYTHKDKLKAKSASAEPKTETQDSGGSRDGQSSQNISEESEPSTDRNDTSDNSESEEGDDFGESILLVDEEDEDLTASQQASEEDKEGQIKKFLKENEKWHKRVLQYEPFDLAELSNELKESGISCGQAKLMNVLDEQCITFRIQQGNKGRHKKSRKKKTRNIEDEI